MLKEKLYSEYHRRYKEYKDKHKKIEELDGALEQLKSEGIRKKSDLESQKKSVLQDISSSKEDFEHQLASVKRNGTNSSVVKEYSSIKLREISSAESDIKVLEKSKQDELKELERKKKEAVSGLESDKELCQKRLNDLMNGGDGSEFVRKFDEAQLRQRLGKDKDAEVDRLSSEYDSAITKTQNAIQGIDSEYTGILKRELSYVENNDNLRSVYGGLAAKASVNEMPQVITGVLEETVDSFVQRNGINGGQKTAQIADMASSLDDLSGFQPRWLTTLISIGFPAIVGVGLLLFFIISGVHWRFVATAINAIVTFLFWVLCVGIGFGILYGILGAIKGKVAGIVGGIIGAIIGLLIALDWAVALPYGFTNIVEWIVKVIVIVAIVFGLHMLNTCTGLGDFLTSIGMKLGFVKKAALMQQGYEIQEHADSYYALIRYSEIISYAVECNKQKRSSSLMAELSRLQNDKVTSGESLVKKLDSETERTVAAERAAAEASRKQQEQKQMSLIQMQDECMIELSGYDGRIQDETAKYDEKIQKSTSSFEKKIADTKARLQQLKASIASDKDTLLAQLEKDIAACDSRYSNTSSDYDERIAKCESDYKARIDGTQVEIDKKNEEFATELDAIHSVFDNINNNTVGFEESQGVLSDYIYLFNKNSKDDPKKYASINHDKKPIVFLYDIEESTNVSASLFEFMEAVLAGFYSINAKDAFDVIITDPVSKARKFEQMTRFLSIENDIRKLSDSVQNSMREVAKKGMHIDDYNRKMSEDCEDKVKFFKYKIVEFIVPEESAAQNTNFFDSDLWGTLGDGKENGFIPIFYINYSDWKNTFDEDSKLNSKFILQLKNSIGTSNGCVYKIDTENITIEKIN